MVEDEATGEVKWSVQAHSLRSDAYVAMSPNGRFVASVGFRDDDWKIWDAAGGELHRVVATHYATGSRKRGLCEVAFSPCGQRLATRGFDGAVILWDARTGEAEHRMHQSEFSRAIAFSADGTRLANGTARAGNSSIDVFDTTTGEWLRTIEEDHYVTCVSFSPTITSMFATAGYDSQINLWDIDSGEMTRKIEENGSACCRIAIFSPDGRTIATVGVSDEKGNVQLMDAGSGALRSKIVAHECFITCAAWCPYNGSKLASGSHDGTCKVWDSTTGALLRTIELLPPSGGIRGRETFASMAWGRNWVRDTQRAMAFAMGQHPQLGAGSQVLQLEVGVVRMILDRV